MIVLRAYLKPHLLQLEKLKEALMLTRAEVVQWVRSKSARAFYEEAATAAAALGVSVDVYAVSAGGCCLDAMEPLASRSGGVMYLYPHVEAAALPQVHLMPSSTFVVDALYCYSSKTSFHCLFSEGHFILDQS